MKRSFLLAILFLIPISSYAQRSISITDNDKAQLVRTILKNYNFRKDSADWKDNNLNAIYLFTENISAEKIPLIKGIKFIFVTRKEIDQLDETVSEFYKFGEFQTKGRLVKMNFSRLYLHPINGDGTVTQYEYRKAANKWKIKEINVIEIADSPS